MIMIMKMFVTKSVRIVFCVTQVQESVLMNVTKGCGAQVVTTLVWEIVLMVVKWDQEYVMNARMVTMVNFVTKAVQTVVMVFVTEVLGSVLIVSISMQGNVIGCVLLLV